MQLKNRYLAFLFVIVLVYAAACPPAQPPATAAPASSDAKPSPQQQADVPPTAQKQEISAEVKELFDKSKTRVRSIYYKYRGPETGRNFYEFYVKGDKIKYKPYLEIKSLDRPDSYDAVFVDKTASTAQSYCTAAYCAYKGKKEDLSYASAYLPTVFDWIGGLDKASKVGEEVIDSRSTWKIDTNKGVLWIDTFYGIPLKAESGGKTYRYEQISVTSVEDPDVTPP